MFKDSEKSKTYTHTFQFRFAIFLFSSIGGVIQISPTHTHRKQRPIEFWSVSSLGAWKFMCTLFFDRYQLNTRASDFATRLLCDCYVANYPVYVFVLFVIPGAATPAFSIKDLKAMGHLRSPVPWTRSQPPPTSCIAWNSSSSSFSSSSSSSSRSSSSLSTGNYMVGSSKYLHRPEEDLHHKLLNKE